MQPLFLTASDSMVKTAAVSKDTTVCLEHSGPFLEHIGSAKNSNPGGTQDIYWALRQHGPRTSKEHSFSEWGHCQLGCMAHAAAQHNHSISLS